MTATMLPMLCCNGVQDGQPCPMYQTALDAPPGARIRTADDLRAALSSHGWTYMTDGRDLCWCCNPAEELERAESLAEQASWARTVGAINPHK